jgi:tricarballylate dehydrogenase
MSLHADLIVVGCGVAGLSAAVTAAEGGAKVILLERAPKEDRGGGSRYTDAWLMMGSEGEVRSDFEEMLSSSGHGAILPQLLEESITGYESWSANLKSFPFTDPVLISTFAESAPPTIAWLKSHGVKFTYGSPFLLQKAKPYLAPAGGGLAIVEALAAAAEKLGVEFRYQTTARSLVLSGDGDVVGLNVWSPEKKLHSISSKAVVLACGGFQGNVEMMTRYVGANAYLAQPVSAGSLYNKGEGIEMALAIGAAPAGQFEMFHAEPIDPRSHRHEALVAGLNFGILVNNSAERFFDEGKDLYEHMYDEVSWTIMRQKKGVAYFIYDSALYDIPNIRVRLKSDVSPYRAGSIRSLASMINVDADALEKTVRTYNAAVQDGEFDSTMKDGKSCAGLTVPKSNWARKINESDLYAYPVVCANTFTCGGLKIDSDARVMNRDGAPIPGLYAAGELVGLYYGLYIGATSVLRGLVFGRRAGQSFSRGNSQSR